MTAREPIYPSSFDYVRTFVGKYCDFRWTEADGREGGMLGFLEKVEQDERGVWWAVVDYGYGAAVGHFAINEASADEAARVSGPWPLPVSGSANDEDQHSENPNG